MLEVIGGLAELFLEPIIEIFAELFLEPFVEIFGEDISRFFARQFGRRQIIGLTFLGKRLS